MTDAAPRRPHTIYVTDATWRAIERRYLEARLASSATVGSKIDFVEQLIHAGLAAVGDPVTPETPEAQPASVPEPVAVPETVPSPPQTPPAPTSPPQTAARPRRPSALERLKASSDPGRPPTIQSAADPTM